MLWTRNGKIIVRGGKVIDCDECPCCGRQLCFYGGGMEYIGDDSSSHPTRMICAIDAKSYAQNVYAVGHVDDILKWVVGGQPGGEDPSSENHDVNGLLFSIPAGDDASVSVVDTHNVWFGFEGYIIVAQKGCVPLLPPKPWNSFDYYTHYEWDLSKCNCKNIKDEDEFE